MASTRNSELSNPSESEDRTFLKKEEHITFDHLLEKLRSFGPYQIKVFILTTLFDFPGCWVSSFFLFGGYNPGFYCLSKEAKLAQDNGTFSIDAFLNRTDALQADTCTVNGSKCAAIVFRDSYHSAVSEFSLVCDLSYINNFFTTIMMFGILLGAYVFGQLADILGRKHTLYASCVLLQVSLFCLGLSVNWQMFAAFRFVGGFAVAGVVCVGYILPMEMIGPQWRTVCGCVACWQLGSISFAGLGYLIPHWRHLAYATGTLGLPLLFSWFVVPESPRWLVQQGRIPEALAVLQAMAQANGRPAPTEKDVMRITRMEEVTNYTIKDMFRTRTLTIRSLLMAFIWLTCNMGTYGLAMHTRDMGGDIYINVLIMSVIEFFFTFSIIFTAKWFGRRPTLLAYQIIAGVCLFVAVGLNFTKANKVIEGTISAIGRASVMSTWYIAYLLTAELFPTLIRTLANGSCSVAGRIGGILAPQVAFLSHIHPVLPGCIYGAFILVSTILSAILVPETKGTLLPDVLPPRLGCCTHHESDDDCLREAKSRDNITPDLIVPNSPEPEVKNTVSVRL